MPVRRYAICDECGESKIPYSSVSDRDELGFEYSEVLDSGEPQFAEVMNWVVKAREDPEDPIVVDFQYYCPDCVSQEQYS